MNDLLNALKGKRTYLVAALFGLLAFAENIGWIDAATANTLKTALIGAGFAALRAGAGK